MEEVKRYGRIGSMAEALPQLVQAYPEMTVYVLASDFDRVKAEREALQLMLNNRDELDDQLTSLEQRRYAEQLAPVAVVMPERLQQVLKFLDGAENLDGHWFSEPHPSGRSYWWRTELRKALEETTLFAKPE